MATWDFDCNTAPVTGAIWVVNNPWGTDGASIVADPSFQTASALRIDTEATGDDQYVEVIIPTSGEMEFSVLCTNTHVDHGGYSWLFVGGTIQRWRAGSFQGNPSYTLPTEPYTIRCESVAGVQKVFVDDVEVDSWTDGSPLVNGATRSYQEIASKGGRIGNVEAGDIEATGPTEPGKVTGLDTTAFVDEVDLDWVAPADGGEAITDYVIQWAPDVAGSPGSWTTITDGTSTSTTYTDTGLTVDTIYWYHVAAVNSIGQGEYSDPVSATTSDGIDPEPPGVWQDATPLLATLDPDDPSAGANYGFQSVTAGADGTIYAVEDYHGLFRSSDGGATWEGPFQVGAAGGTCWTIQVDPFDDDILWAKSGDGGPLRSTDRGDNWTKFPVGSPTNFDDVYCIAMDPYLEGHMLVAWHSNWSTGDSSGISESFDGGSTWENHEAPDDSWGTGHAVFFLSDSDTWLVGTQVDGVYRTDDGATIWDQVIVENMTHGATDCLTKVGSTLVIALEHSVRISTDDGLTWSDISTGLPGDFFSNVATDGENLYTAPSFPITPNYAAADGPWFTRPIASGSWTEMTGSPDVVHDGNANGPRQSVLTNDYVVTSNYMAGIWRMALEDDTPTNKFFQFL